MRKVILLILISSTVFGYVVPPETAEKIPHGSDVRTFIRSIGDPIRDKTNELVAQQLPRVTNFLVNAGEDLAQKGFDTFKATVRESLHINQGVQNNLDEQKKEEINKSVDKDVNTLL